MGSPGRELDAGWVRIVIDSNPDAGYEWNGPLNRLICANSTVATGRLVGATAAVAAGAYDIMTMRNSLTFDPATRGPVVVG